MKKPSRRAVLAGMALFIFCCLVRAPVSLLTHFVPAIIQLKQVEGSLWQGQIAAIGLNNQIVAERFGWNFLPASLLNARLEWQFSSRFAGKPGQMTLSLGIDGVTLKNLDLHLPLEPLLAQHPQIRGMRLGGEIHAQAALLKTGSKAEARLQLDKLFSAMVPQQPPLGSYRVDLSWHENGKGQWKLLPLAGVLQAEGNGTLDLQNREKPVGGEVTLTPQAPIPGLTPVLSTLPAVDKGYRLAF